MTSTLDRPDCPPTVHGPAEVRAAIVACSNELGVQTFDRNMDAAYKNGPEALRKFLDYWWALSQVAVGNGTLEDYGLRRPGQRGMGRADFIKAWEAAHPGESLLDAA